MRRETEILAWLPRSSFPQELPRTYNRSQPREQRLAAQVAQ